MSDEKKKVWLLGTIISSLTATKFPTKECVLKTFLYNLSINRSVLKSKNVVASEVLDIWKSCGISCIRIDKVCDKLGKLYDEYNKLKK